MYVLVYGRKRKHSSTSRLSQCDTTTTVLLLFQVYFLRHFFGCGNNVTKYDNSKNVIFRDSLFHPVQLPTDLITKALHNNKHTINCSVFAKPFLRKSDSVSNKMKWEIKESKTAKCCCYLRNHCNHSHYTNAMKCINVNVANISSLSIWYKRRKQILNRTSDYAIQVVIFYNIFPLNIATFLCLDERNIYHYSKFIKHHFI